MTLSIIKLSMMIVAVTCLPSCGSQSVELPSQKDETGLVEKNSAAANNSAQPSFIVKSKAEEIDPDLHAGPKFIYKADAKLKKIDRNWLIRDWLYIPPDQAFQMDEKFQCATDAYETYAKNGDIIDAEDGEKIGSWEFSLDKLKTTYFNEYDENGRAMKKISTTTSHVGKISENRFIAIKDDGSLETYIEC